MGGVEVGNKFFSLWHHFKKLVFRHFRHFYIFRPISADSQISQLCDPQKRPPLPRRYRPRCQRSLPGTWGTARRQGRLNMSIQHAHKHSQIAIFAHLAGIAKNRDLITTAAGFQRLAAVRHAACAASRMRRPRPDVGTARTCAHTTITQCANREFQQAVQGTASGVGEDEILTSLLFALGSSGW